ncbi:MAG: hypothetical protein KJO69_01135 [Gammaproteobacteria bacterium]|nr:hypothetical protein [Gammaproteobacteria bacterium]
MRLKKEPIKPKRLMVEKEASLSAFDNVQEVIDYVEGLDVFPAEVSIVRSGGWDYDEFDLVWKVPEPENVYQARVVKYEQLKAEYDTWYEKNKEAVEKEIALREETKKIKKEKQELATKSRKELAKEIQHLNERLMELGERFR